MNILNTESLQKERIILSKLVPSEVAAVARFAYPQGSAQPLLNYINQRRKKTIEQLITISFHYQTLGFRWNTAYAFLETVEEIISYIMKNGEVDWIDYPPLLIWLRKAKILAKSSKEVQQLHAQQLVLILIKYLEQMPQFLADTIICIPANTTIYPYGMLWSIKNNSSVVQQLHFHYAKDPYFLVVENKQKFVINEEFIDRNKNGGSSSPLQFFRRLKLERPAIEFMSIMDFAEFNVDSGEIFPEYHYTNIINEASVAFEYLENIWPEAAEEFALLCRVIIPYYDGTKLWKSASAPEFRYIEKITFRPYADALLVAEQYVHETSHIKLELCQEFIPLLEDNGEEKFYHAWRKEKRPITSILIAGHAFLAVAGLFQKAYQARKEDWIEAYIIDTLDNVAKALQPLEKEARFTAHGQSLMDELVNQYTSLTQQFPRKLVQAHQHIINTPLGNTEHVKANFEYFVIPESTFDKKLLEEILFWLENYKYWSRSKTNFYDQFEMMFKPKNIPMECQLFFTNENLKKYLETLTKVFKKEFYPFLKINAHLLSQGQSIDIHTDRQVEMGETHRVLLQLNRGWSNEYGGYLLFFNSNSRDDTHRVIKPLHGSMMAFECNNLSYHAVSKVHNWQRYTLVVSAWAKEKNINHKHYMHAISEDNKSGIFRVE